MWRRRRPRDDVGDRDLRVGPPERHVGRPARRRGPGSPPGWHRWAYAAPRRPCCGSTRPTASTAPAAPGPSRAPGTGRTPSSARTAPRRSPRRRRCAGSRADFFAAHPIAELAARSRPLARPAGPAHRADGAAGRAPTTTDRSRWDDAFALIADPAARAATRRTRRSSTPPAAPPTRPRSATSCFARAFGTNNLPDCSNMCHESSGRRADRDDRRRQGQVTLDDIHAAPS